MASVKAKAAIKNVLTKLKTQSFEDLVPIIAQDFSSLPSQKWSLSNRMWAFYMTGDTDCRGYAQWQQVGRQVIKKGAGYIFVPRILKDKETGENKMCGFLSVPVFGVSQTNGEKLDYQKDAVYHKFPKLLELAERFNVDISTQPTDLLQAHGFFAPNQNKIVLGNNDYHTFFHELAHAIQANTVGLGNYADDEVIAETVAAILDTIYLGNGVNRRIWDYMNKYSDDPVHSVKKLMGVIEKIVDAILTTEEQTEAT